MPNTMLFSMRIDKPAEKSDAASPFAAGLRLFRKAIDGLQEGVILTTLTGDPEAMVVLYANPAAQRLAGNSPVDESSESSGLPQDGPLWKSLHESHQNHGVFTSEVVLDGRPGQQVIVQLRSEPAGEVEGFGPSRVALLYDRTEQVALEEALRRNERLACIGLLAAGIAHEINNPTGSALLAAETALAIMELPGSGEQVSACLRNIVTSMDRCGRIVRTLLRYTREEPSERQACSINDVAEQALELARPYAEHYGAVLRLEAAPDVPLAPMNPLEIELVLINFVRNAVEAGRGDAVIVLRTGATEDSVRVTVSDNGCGMDEGQLAHIFDPLYTTRRQTGGSGIGMSIAYGIIQGHEGRIHVESQPGVGTTIMFDLPLSGDQLQFKK